MLTDSLPIPLTLFQSVFAPPSHPSSFCLDSLLLLFLALSSILHLPPLLTHDLSLGLFLSSIAKRDKMKRNEGYTTRDEELDW